MKTGKSYTLENLVPAVLAKELSQQGPDHPLKGMTVLRLNCLRLDRQGATALLYSLLETMVGWVERAGVKVKADAWEQATRVRGDAAGSRTRTRAGTAILELLQGLETPVLVLMDELQALLQPLDERGEPDLDGVSYIRDVVLRQILVASPDNVLWAVTGSSMAFVWTALAAMPVAGVAPILQLRQVDTPSVWPPGLMAALVDDLGGVWGVRPEDVAPLLERAGSSPALFMTMLESWVMEGRPADVAAFANTFTYHKLYKEAFREWQLGPAHWTDEERGLLLDLTDPVTGAAAWELQILDPGLQRFLKPHLKQTGEERSYLADPTQRQLLRAVLLVDNNGKGGARLRRQQHCWAGLPAPGLTLEQLDWGWLLLHLGQVADFLLLGVGERPLAEDVIPKDARGAQELKAMLRDLADKVEPKLPEGSSVASRWEALGTFTKLLGSPHNKGRRSWYQREGRDGKLRSHLDYLVFFLRLSRNVVARWEPREGREVLSSALLALPTLVDMRVADLSEVVLAGMSQLEAATVAAAAAAAEREDQMDEAVEAGGGGGGGGGSGYDANRRGGGAVAAPAVYGGGRSSTGAGLVNWRNTSSSSSSSSSSASSSASSASSSASSSSTASASSSSSASSSWPRRTALGRSGAPSARHTSRLALPPPAPLHHRVTRLAVAARALFRFAM